MNHAAGNAPRTTALLTAVMPTPAAAAMFLRPRASASSDAVIMGPLYPQIVDHCKSTIREFHACAIHHLWILSIHTHRKPVMMERQHERLPRHHDAERNPRTLPVP